MREVNKSLILFILIFVSQQIFGQQSEPPLIKLGIMADVQFCNAKNSGSRFYRLSSGKLREACEQLKKEQVDWIIGLGDFIDRDFESYDTLRRPSRKSYVPLIDEKLQFAVLGKESSRHLAINNLPGTQEFFPLIRKTPKPDIIILSPCQSILVDNVDRTAMNFSAIKKFIPLPF